MTPTKRTLFWIGLLLAGWGILVLDAGSTQDTKPRLRLAGSVDTRQEQRSAPPSLNTSASASRALLDRYCTTCHNARLKTAGLVLDAINVEDIGAAAETWEKVVLKLRTRAMPPDGLPRPDNASYDTLASWLEGELDGAAAAHPNPGRPALHRLNRAEYANAIRDLLGLEIDARSLLPADDSGYGFDNIASVLSLSPTLLERYMGAAHKIARLTIGDPSMRPTIETYEITKFLRQDDRLSDDLPFGSRGGAAIRHHFPLDGEYLIKIRLQRTYGDLVKGMENPNQLDVRLDGKRIALFNVGGDPRAKAAASDSLYHLTADAGLEVRATVKAGMRLLGISFLDTPSEPEGVHRLRLIDFAFEASTETNPGIATIEIHGPNNAQGAKDTETRRDLFVCYPKGAEDQESCARTILSRLARRAYRRPVAPRDVETLLEFYKTGSREGGFEAGIQLALERLLVGPDFLFRVERDPVDSTRPPVYRISDIELASRLSFFLWSSIPDDALLDIAAAGKLRDPVVLERQVRRMLADPRSAALVSNFGGQWLELRNMRLVNPDSKLFSAFDENLRIAFQRETELFLESQLREDRSVTGLLDANYTFLNQRLAEHYGIPNVYGSHFRRVTLNEDSPRRGLLGQGSVLTVTSYADRTSIVLRGKWVLDNILGAPPPPPPADVPALEDTKAKSGAATMRERMEQHRTNPVCTSCHARMDPLGFALEHFDAIGMWRTHDANAPINGSGVLFDGTMFNGPIELRKALLNHRANFARVVTEKLLTYALGRGVEYYDAPAVRTILRDAAPGDYRWSSIILGIVRSQPFQMRLRLS